MEESSLRRKRLQYKNDHGFGRLFEQQYLNNENEVIHAQRMAWEGKNFTEDLVKEEREDDRRQLEDLEQGHTEVEIKKRRTKLYFGETDV